MSDSTLSVVPSIIFLPKALIEGYRVEPRGYSNPSPIAETCTAAEPVVISISKPASNAGFPLSPPRCAVKGCVFPATADGKGTCHYHQLQQAEPTLFQSRQPSFLLVFQAPCELPEGEPDDSREQDKRRHAKEREAFLRDESA